MFIYTIVLFIPVNDCPDDKYLNKYVRGKVCAAGTNKWRDLGIVLMGQDAVTDLDMIRVDYPYNVKECCSRMFTEWRQRTPKASWKQLIEALKEVKLAQLASELEELLIPSVECCVEQQSETSQLPLQELAGSNKYCRCVMLVCLACRVSLQSSEPT